MTATFSPRTAARLRGRLSGRLALPGEAEYEAARQVRNASHDYRPALVVQPRSVADARAGFTDMIVDVLAGRLGITDVTDKTAMISAFERHNNTVRATAPPGRLLEWRPVDGWEPIAAALGLSAPDMPFPKVNTGREFRARFLSSRAAPGEPADLPAAQRLAAG